MGQGALSKPVVQWWLSLNSSTGAWYVPTVGASVTMMRR